MAGLTYFWTRHAVKIYCVERYGEYLHSQVIILAVFVGHYGITYVVTVALMQGSIRSAAVVMQHKNSAHSYFQLSN